MATCGCLGSASVGGRRTKRRTIKRKGRKIKKSKRKTRRTRRRPSARRQRRPTTRTQTDMSGDFIFEPRINLRL